MNSGGTLQDAVSLVQSGNVEAAIEVWTSDIEAPAIHERILILSEACRAAGREKESLELLERALTMSPDNVRCLCAVGDAFESRNLLPRAFECFFKASRLAPEDAAAWCGIGYLYFKARKLTEALSCLQKSFQLQPANPDTSNRLGLVLLGLKKNTDAVRWFLNSIKLKPDSSQAWCNLAVAWRNSDEIQLALRACKNAVKLEPTSAANWMNLGVLYQELNHIEEALFAYRKAVSLDEGFHLAHVNEGIALLLKGDLPAGWIKYEHRWQTAEVRKHRHERLPFWKGNEPIQGKSILLHSDQGFGDTIQCLRFVRILSELGALVHIEVNEALVRLASQLDTVAAVHALGEAADAYDFQCPFLSLPFACNVSLDNLPNAVPYLRPSLQAIEKWSNTPARDGVLRVGLVWRGNPEHDNDRNRSLSLAALGPLLESKNCEFVSLQWDLSEEEQRVIAAHPNMNNPRPKIASFDDTAALMAHLDLVISVDTAVAHLAGALGRNVWILLPFAPDWRWMLDRADSPWYPTARIFRQSQRGQWNPVVEEVTSLLRKICESRATPANA